MAQRITLRDVANHAGVSVTTVSNVVRDWPYVASETRLKVQQSILELGYSPHPIAQGLRTGRTQVIGFLVPDLSNPHFAAMVSVAEDVAQEHGFSLLVFNSHEDEDREAECIRRVVSRWVDGLLISHVVSAHHTTNLLNNLSIPVVAVDRVPEDFEGAYCSLDNFRAAQLATQHLCDLGHTRIAHLSGPKGGPKPSQDRIEGYLHTIRENGLEYQRVVSFQNSVWGCDEGYNTMRELLNDTVLPTAVFASNDRMAIGASLAIHEHGLRVPEDISLVGVDDIEVSRYMNPPLTTVTQPLEPLARAGIELLLQLIQGETPEQTRLSLMPSLLVRQSTALLK
jgi:DNA-binding LacI/PurR family transcriptional regulator